MSRLREQVRFMNRIIARTPENQKAKETLKFL